ncbi:MAG: CvpA family protein [Campylobacteraceae bacterium]|jgi:membrane protein required for colicin V production|nr:CvpA family protein [Campylobacteraceae bacterium]
MEFSFSWFDLVIVLVILAIGIKGVASGFVKELFAAFGIIGGIFLASRYSQDIGAFVSNNIYDVKNEAATQVIGFVVLLFIVWLVATIIGVAVSKLVDMSGFTSINKLLGFIFSSIKIFLVFSVLIFALSSIEFIREKMANALENSFMYKIFCDVGEQIVDIHPSQLPELPDIDSVIEPIVNATSNVIDTLGNISTSDIVDTFTNITTANGTDAR